MLLSMDEEFLRKYYSVGKTTSVTREFPHHGMSNNELTQIFNDGLGLKD